MRQSITIFLVSLCVFWSGCNNFFASQEEITLRIWVADSGGDLLSGASVTLYTNPSIRNSDAVTRTAGLLMDTTNGVGVVEFTLPKEKDEELVLYATASLAVGQVNWSNLHESGEIIIGEKDKEEFETDITVLTPAELDNSSTTTGLRVLIQDQLGNPVPGANVCLFQNPVASMVNVYSCTGSVASGISDINGVATIFNLAPQVYYINAFTPIGAIILGNDQVFESVLLQENSLTDAGSVSVSPVSISEASSLIISNVVDDSGTPIANADVCLFLDQETAFQSQNCQGSLQSRMTDDFGLAVFANLDSIIYQAVSFDNGQEGIQISEKPLRPGERRFVQIVID